MLISGLFGFTKSHTVNDWGVVERITDDEIFRSVNCLKESSISIKTTGEEDGVFSGVIICDNTFELFVDILCSANKSDWAHTETVRIKSSFSGLDKSWVVGETEIVISAEVRNLFSIWFDGGPLGGCYDSFAFVCTGFFH